MSIQGWQLRTAEVRSGGQEEGRQEIRGWDVFRVFLLDIQKRSKPSGTGAPWNIWRCCRRRSFPFLID